MTWQSSGATKESLDLSSDWADLRSEFALLRADIRRALWVHTITICLLHVLTLTAVIAVLR